MFLACQDAANAKHVPVLESIGQGILKAGKDSPSRYVLLLRSAVY